MRPALVLLLVATALPAAAQTPDRYGYAPPEAQVPMRQAAPRARALRAEPAAAAPAPRTPAPRAPAPHAPPLRMLSWPGKSGAAVLQPASAPVATPALRPVPVMRAAAPPPAPVREAKAVWTPRSRWTASAPRPSSPATTAAASAPSVAAGVGAAPRPTFVAPPGLIAQAPVAPPPPVAAQAAPQGAAAMGPPRNPWYQRWPDAAEAPDPTVSAGVGASLAPGTPAVAAPVAALSGRAPPAPVAAAPVRTASAAPAARSTAKYYSLHAAYGHAPDPAPIPPQFFGPTADLSTPETPEPARATLTANATAAKAAVNAARLQQEAVQ